MAAGGSLVMNPVSELLSLFLVQVVLILVLVRILAKALAKVNQPPVIGEIIAGVLLGPSCFGFIPGFSSQIFPPAPVNAAAWTSLGSVASSADILDIFAQVGLIFFMFFLGLEVDPILLTRSWKSAAPIAISSILCPFAIGAGFSYYLIDVEPTVSDQTTFLLFMGTCLSFTAFPVLARILTSFRLIDDAFGLQCLSIAAIDDVLAWCTLAITLSYAGGGSAVQGVYTMLITAAFVLVLIFIVRPFLVWAHPLFHHSEIVSRDYVALLFLCLCMASIWTEITGVHAFFGAFAFGIIVPKDPLIIHDLAPKIELLVVEFFLPLYFAKSGLRTDLGALDTGSVWGVAFALVGLATVGKLVPVAILARYASKWFGMPMENFEEYPNEMPTGSLAEIEMADLKRVSNLKAVSEGPSKVPSIENSTNNMKSPDNAVPHSVFVTIPDINKDADGLTSPESIVATHSKSHLTNGIALASAASLQNINEKIVSHGNGNGTVMTDINGDGSSSYTSEASLGVESTSSGYGPNIVIKFEYLDWRSCFALGLMMNTRGLVALIALNIGRDNNLIGPKVFTMLVMMALITTFITSPCLHRLYVLPLRAAHAQRNEMRRKRNREVSRAYGQDEMLSIQLETEEDERRQQQEAEEVRAAELAQNRLSISIRPDSSHLMHRQGSPHIPSISPALQQIQVRAHTAHLPYQPPRHTGPVRQLSSLYEPPRKASFGLQSSTTDIAVSENGVENGGEDGKYYQNTVRSSFPQSQSLNQISGPHHALAILAKNSESSMLSPTTSGFRREDALQSMDGVDSDTNDSGGDEASPDLETNRRIRFQESKTGEDDDTNQVSP